MAKRVIDDSTLTAIADNIRRVAPALEGLNFTPMEMPEKIQFVYDEGKYEGNIEGYTEGETAGVEQGKQSQYDEFWDSFQANGTKTNYRYAFAGGGWTAKLFKPKYDIRPLNGDRLFNNSTIQGSLKDLLTNAGVTLDLSQMGNIDEMFYAARFTELPVIDIRKQSSSGYAMFGYCDLLVTIEKLIFSSAGTRTLSSGFMGCSKLKNIVIEGVIGDSISFSVSPLTKDSLKGKEIAAEEYEALSDSVKTNNVYIENDKYYYGGVVTALSSTATGKTLSLKQTAVNAAFETSEGAADGSTSEEWATLVASKPNWTISLV